MALKDWVKKGEDKYETKEFPRGGIQVVKIYKNYIIYHKPASIGSDYEAMGKTHTSKASAHEALMKHIRAKSY
jgi:hypothetical protein